MIDRLKKLNEDIEIYEVFDCSFSSFGRVLDIDTKEIVAVGSTFDTPDGVVYMPSTKEFECLDISKTIKNQLFGTLPAQIGFCLGHSSMLNATEWHTSSEINIAITDLVLILGHRWDIVDNSINSSQFKAFFVPKGTAIEVYSTSLHYCPCQVSDEGFKCVVALPKNTNTELETEITDKLLVAKNKWLIAHEENSARISQGAVAGIYGLNYNIKY